MLMNVALFEVRVAQFQKLRQFFRFNWRSWWPASSSSLSLASSASLSPNSNPALQASGLR